MWFPTTHLYFVADGLLLGISPPASLVTIFILGQQKARSW
jgi:hypothetical protein